MNSKLYLLFGGVGVFLVAGLVLNIPPAALYLVAISLVAVALLTISLDLLLITLIFIRPSLDILGNISVQLSNDLPPINIAGMIAVISIILSLVIIRKKKIKWKEIPLSRFILLFLALYVVFVAFAEDIAVAINEVVRVVSFLMIFFAGYALVDSEEDLQTLIKVFIFSSIIPVLVSLMELITGQGIYTNPGFDNRIMGTFGHPNVLGYFLLVIISLIVYLFLDHKIDKNNRDLMILYVGVLSVLLINTYTRGAWIGLFLLIVGVLLILSPGKTIKFSAISTPIVGVGLIVYTWLQAEVFFSWPRLAGIPIVSRMLGLFSADPSDSILWRQQMWSDMFERGLERPLTGFGTGMSEIEVERVRGIMLGSLEIHNDYIRMFVEMGIWGFVVFCILVISILYTLWKYYRTTKSTFTLITLFLSFVIFMSSVWDNLLRGTVIMWLYFCILGMTIRAHQLSQQSKLARQDHTRTP